VGQVLGLAELPLGVVDLVCGEGALWDGGERRPFGVCSVPQADYSPSVQAAFPVSEHHMLYLPRRQPQPLGDLRVRQALAAKFEHLREEQACRAAAVASAVEERLDGVGAVDPTQGFREESWPRPIYAKTPAGSIYRSRWRCWWRRGNCYPIN
jgi:hypothetical protein